MSDAGEFGTDDVYTDEMVEPTGMATLKNMWIAFWMAVGICLLAVLVGCLMNATIDLYRLQNVNAVIESWSWHRCAACAVVFGLYRLFRR